MKILYVITGLSQGGAERVVCDLADKMYERGHIVKIAYLTGSVLTRPTHKEVELVKIELNNIISLPKACIKLSKLIKSYKPDVVHSHMVHANILTRLIRIVSPIDRLVSTAHNSNEGGRIRMLLYRLTHSLADITTNVSKEATIAFENLGAVPKNGMSTIYNGIDLDKFKYSPNARVELNKELLVNNDHRIILAVGRFNEQKDYPNLLTAIQILKNEASFPFKLIIVGDGELRAAIENMINELDLTNQVILLGRRDDIPNLMSAVDLFVLSSKYEGFGLVVAEAMACKCLVVATDCGGVAEVLNSPDFLVPALNPELLKDKIKYAIDLNDNEKQNVIEKNVKHVKEKFSLDSIVDQWVNIYHEK